MANEMASRGGGLAAALRSGDLHAFLARYADVAVAGFVLLSVAMLIVPLPPAVLDVLITVNLAAAVVLLLCTIYAGDALGLATFPTLLLLTTLFRVALEVSATRLILLHASAGHVIAAFGGFVVAGNLVVGVVVFLILTTVQYVVIAKGSARVAEVAARFTLDAMPGKQMAIDAELRAGHLDREQAAGQRSALARESQFFGAMDGAMKFVKGDAVAGIVVLLVNLIGGLVIGVLQRGMDLGQALRTYALLTVGEGLVAQIPALVISTAAGILVTRVAPDERGAQLGRDIGRQLLAEPRALALAAGLLAGLAAIPGLPALPFLVLAAAVGLVTYWRLRARASAAGGAEPLPAGRGPLRAPVEIVLAPDLAKLLLPERAPAPLLAQWLPTLRAEFFAETGIAVPLVTARAGDGDLAGLTYVIKLHEIPVARGSVGPSGSANPAGIIVGDLRAVLRRHGHRLVGVDETQALLDRLARTQPALVREVVPASVSVVVLADVLRLLAREGISLRHLGDVLTALARRPPGPEDPEVLAEHARSALQPQLTFQHASPDGSMHVHFVDAGIEETVREAIRDGEGRPRLALPPDLAQDIVAAVGRAVDGVARPVIVTSADVRRHLRSLIESEQPDVAVLAYQEIVPETKLVSLGHIAL